MTGPEHYLEGERALSILNEERDEAAWLEAIRSGELALAIQAAQVHATLALAAATALYDADFAGGDDAEYQAWRKIAGTVTS